MGIAWILGLLRDLVQSMKQAQALAERMRAYDPDNPNLPMVEAYAGLQYDSPMQRIKKIKRLGIHAQNSPRQLLLFSRLLLSSRVADD